MLSRPGKEHKTNLLPFALTAQTSWTYFSFFYEDDIIPKKNNKATLMPKSVYHYSSTIKQEFTYYIFTIGMTKM